MLTKCLATFYHENKLKFRRYPLTVFPYTSEIHGLSTHKFYCLEVLRYNGNQQKTLEMH